LERPLPKETNFEGVHSFLSEMSKSALAVIPLKATMDLFFALLCSFVLLVFSVTKGIFIAYPLLIAMVVMIILLVRRGFASQGLTQMAWMGSRQSVPVFSVLLLIGVVIAAWMAVGTVPATILMTDPGFIPFAFYLYLLPLINLLQIGLNNSPPRYIFSRPYRSN